MGKYQKLALIAFFILYFIASIGFIGCSKEQENQVPSDIVLIPAGEFQMGSDSGDADERPVHTVFLDAFYIDKFEVTNAQYQKFVEATGYPVPSGKGYLYTGDLLESFRPWDDQAFNQPNHPVVNVTWFEAKAYCEWAGKRLPTEAEWEKAACGGLSGKKYPWGDEEPDDTRANFADKNVEMSWANRSVDDGHAYPAPVGSYQSNGYGLYDMSGNVWEWCADWYDEAYYSQSPKRNPKGPLSGRHRVLKGGSWYRASHTLRCAERVSDVPESRLNVTGFRCAKDAR
jgi:formylglycine-generating enzyme required for sulfatase activity